MPPEWLTVIAWIWLRVAFITSGVILFDIFVGGHHQRMGMIEAVYPIAALYIGPLAFGLTVADRSFFRRVHRGIQSRRRARVVFEYFAIPPMRGLRLREGIKPLRARISSLDVRRDRVGRPDDNGLSALSCGTPPDAGRARRLVAHASRDDRRIFHGLTRERLAP
jgi:hypothetical protein